MGSSIQQREQGPGPVAQAKMLAQSTLVPKHYQNQPANCLIAVDYAQHMRQPVLGIMRATFVVHGTLGFKSEFLIGMANASGIFDRPIGYESRGEIGARDYAVRAGSYIDGQAYWGPWVSWDMVSEEGWLSNSKYKSMPEVMFRYRAATFFVRQTCPQVLLGAQTVEELEDMGDEEPRDVAVENGAAAINAAMDAEATPEPEAAQEVSEEGPEEATGSSPSPQPITVETDDLPF